MEWLYTLFFGNGIAHAVLIFALVITIGILVGKSQNRRHLAGCHVDTVRRHPVQPFRDDRRRRSAALRAGIRICSFCVFSIGTGGRSGILLRRSDTAGTSPSVGCAAAIVLLGVATAYVIHVVTGTPIPTMVGILSGRRDQHPRAGRRAAGLCRRLGVQRPQRRAGLRRGLSAGRGGHHLHDDLHPLRPAREIRKGGRGAGRAGQGAEIRRERSPWSSPTRCSTDARWNTCAIWSTASS